MGIDWNSTGCVVNGVATLACIQPVIANLIRAALFFGGSVAAIVLIFGGIKFIRSRGDPKNVQAAQQTMTWAIVGLLIVLFAFGIVSFIGFLTGSQNSCVFSFISGNSTTFGCN